MSEQGLCSENCRLRKRPMAAVAKVAKTFGRSHSVPKLLASFATGIFLLTARLTQAER
jgi:hypothetical protein